MSADEELQLVTFRVAGQEFGLNIFDVERIIRYETPAKLPQAPDFLEGMLPYDPGSIPVIDLRRRLSAEAAINEETRIMIIEWKQGKVGIVVDAVTELVRVPVADVIPPPALVRGLAAKYISGIYTQDARTIILLALNKLLTSKERLTLETLTAEAGHGA